ncbi:MAG: hypothetical protein Fur0043_23520 [Anaerolineales bacterium]
MRVYSCGNCGYVLPGPVGRCPRCGVLLRGEREGSEEERRRRERAYQRNRPEAIERRQKTRDALQMIGFGLVGLLIAAIFVGGGAALGRFVLARLFGKDAALPFSLGGAILGAVLLYPIVWQITNPLGFPWDYPDWKYEMRKKERAAEWNVVVLSVLLFFLAIPVLGIIGWYLALIEEDAVRWIVLVVLAMLFYGIYRIAKRHKIPLDWWLFIVSFLAANEGLTKLLEKLNPGSILYKPEHGAVIGILIGTALAFYGARQLAKPAPDSWEKQQQEVLQAIVEDPSRFQDLDQYEQEAVLTELRKLAEAAPEAFKLLSPGLQKLVPPHQTSASRSASARKKKQA